jgi:VCBS repeat-containing protein
LTLTLPHHQGTVSIEDGQLKFVPDADFDSLADGQSTNVTVQYVVVDEEGLESTSTATITVNGTNDGPQPQPVRHLH